MKKLIFIFLPLFLIGLCSCKTLNDNSSYILQRDPDLKYLDELIEKDLLFAALQEIFYIEKNERETYEKFISDGTLEEYKLKIFDGARSDFEGALKRGDYDRAISIYYSLITLKRTDLAGGMDITDLYLAGADSDCLKENYITALYKFYKYLNFVTPSAAVLEKYGDIAKNQNNRYMLRIISDLLPAGKKKSEYINILDTIDPPAALMKGTVTIWVNKGTKLQSGVGVPDRAIGSGFFIDKRGYIITNYHVIESEVDPEYEGFSRLFIRLPDSIGSRVPAKVVAWDPIFDIALLKTEISPEYIFNFSLNNDFNPGDKIYAIGSPGGLENTITSGIISAGRRKFLPIGDVLQVDVPVNPGNSGGPLINGNNEVMGVVFAGISRFQGINFVIPSHWIMDLMDDLFREGKVHHSWIGLVMYEKNNVLEVLYSIPGEPGNRIGLKNGDIIRKINGIECRSITQVHKITTSVSPDTMLMLEWERDGVLHTDYIASKERQDKAFDIALKKDSKKNVILPLFGMKVESTGNYIFKEGYVIKKIYQGLPAYESDLSVNDPFSLKDWKYDSKGRYVIMQIYVKKKKAGFMESGLQLGAYLDENNLI